jgi:hypothetical protein
MDNPQVLRDMQTAYPAPPQGNDVIHVMPHAGFPRQPAAFPVDLQDSLPIYPCRCRLPHPSMPHDSGIQVWLLEPVVSAPAVPPVSLQVLSVPALPGFLLALGIGRSPFPALGSLAFQVGKPPLPALLDLLVTMRGIPLAHAFDVSIMVALIVFAL